MKIKKKSTPVRAHVMRVPVSEKNPVGTTIRDKHERRLPGSDLDADGIRAVFEGYPRKGILYPSKGKLKEFPDSDIYDEHIAVWNDYFNKKFSADPVLDPDVIKALIASESGFRADPPENKKAIGLTQIIPSTLKVLKDPKGEAKDFIFRGIRKKDLKDPEIAIPLAIRWLHRKKRLADGKLGRSATAEEIILEYKGMLKSKTELKMNALGNYRKHYDRLKKKTK